MSGQDTRRDARAAAAYASLAAVAAFVSVASLVATMPSVWPFAAVMVPAVVFGVMGLVAVHRRTFDMGELWRVAPASRRRLAAGTAAVLVASMAVGGGPSTSMAGVRDGRYVALQHDSVVRVLSKREYEDLRMKELRTGMTILGVLSGIVAFIWSTIGAVETAGELGVVPKNPPDGRVS